MYTGDSGACCGGKVVLGGRFREGGMKERGRNRGRESSEWGSVGMKGLGRNG